MYDVVIIGAGVSGSACARELSRYNLSICVVEKEGGRLLRHFQSQQQPSSTPVSTVNPEP